jgi:protein-disulfide isomerase
MRLSLKRSKRLLPHVRHVRGLGPVVLMLLAVTTAQQASTASSQDSPQTIQALKNPQNSITRPQADQILQELQQIRELLQKQEAQLARIATPVSPTAANLAKVRMGVGTGWHAMGRTNAPVTLVEFVDYQCPFCKRFQTEIFPELKKNYIDSGKVQFISRDMPLEFHPYSFMAAEAARCAGDQEKYWEMHDALITYASPWSYEVVPNVAIEISLNMKTFQACVQSGKYRSDVQKDASEAAALQISGTPAFVLAKSAGSKLDGSLIVGAQPFAAFQSAIDALLKVESTK